MEGQVQTTDIKPAPAKAPRARKAAAPKAKAPAKKAAPKSAKKPAAKKAAPKAKKAPANAAQGGITALSQAAQQYNRDTENKTAGGHVSVDNGDDVAEKLRGKDLDAVYAYAARTLKVEEKELRGKYKHLNPGMIRMNLGNRVRAVLNAK